MNEFNSIVVAFLLDVQFQNLLRKEGYQPKYG